ncbi:uncharacterized protein [Palaemon carinicauda]|uniref:uncharacterized protein n=1 Tax=Palaemon carinicauda TaxID=392227 RepID=UPI0035B6471F
MFPRTLILVAISAAFASGIPPSTPFASVYSPSAPFASGIPPSAHFASVFLPPIDPRPIITYELQRVFRPKDPHTFPFIDEFNYNREDTSYFIEFSRLKFKGFSNFECHSFNVIWPHLTTVDLKGIKLEFHTTFALLDTNASDLDVSLQPTNFTSQVSNYTLRLEFINDIYSTYPFYLCIKKETLTMTFSAEKISTYIDVSEEGTQELNDHPKAVVKAINHYLDRLTNNLTTILNKELCKPPFHPSESNS